MAIKLDPEIISGFVREVESYLPKLIVSIAEHHQNPSSPDNLEEAYRMVHCIRGAGSTIGLFALSQIAQYQEDTLEQLLNGQISWTDEVFHVLTSATGKIGEYLDKIRTGSEPEPDLVAGLVRAFRRMRQLPESDDDAEIKAILSPDSATGAPDQEQAPEAGEQFHTARMEPHPPPQAVMETLDEPTADEELWNAFQEEAAGHFETLAGNLAVLETKHDTAALKAIRRSVHQLKGASGVIGMKSTSKLNAGMQKVLDRILEEEAVYTPDLLPLFQETFEVVIEAVGGKGSGVNLAGRAEALLARYERILETPAPAVQASQTAASQEEDRVDAADDLWEAFHQEAEEHLHIVGDILRAMGSGTPAADQVQSIRRSVHTFKGACGMVGLRLTASVAHRMEDVLDALYEGRLGFSTSLTPLLFDTFDILTDSVAARGIRHENLEKLQGLFARYNEALGGARPEKAEEPAKEKTGEREEIEKAPDTAERGSTPAAGRKSSQFVRAPLERVDELVRLVSELVIHRSRFEQYLSAYIHEVGELQLSTERLTRISRKLQSDYEAAALQEANRRLAFAATSGGRGFSGGVAGDFDALEFDRYTEFHLLSRDLAETTGDVTNAGTRLNELISDFDGYLNRLGVLTGEVEDRLMRLRMLPLRNLSSRLHRTTRVTAERRNKSVELVMEGETVELDKTVLEEMAGPLEHILRNAVDHGIETPEARRRAGKPERGTIVLRAYHEGTQVVIQVRDDGAGIDAGRLRESAIRQGYLSQEDEGELSDSELYSLIFLPGFSTASELSEVSGRGVGLDVVKSAVSKMKGTLSISSERGRGTTFTIRLPMTMALTRVVLVRSANETYAIPLAAVSQVLRIEPEQLERVGRKPVLRLGGKVVPTMYLAEFTGQQVPPDANLTRLKAVVLNIGDQRLALMVDMVLEAREVVVKTLGNMLGRVRGVTGATLMGDGSVVLILNPNDMLQQQAASPQVRLRPTPVSRSAADNYQVLIVDDSPSVRRVLTTLVRNTGWTPYAAKDGLEALEMIHASVARPDVVLLDIEMPRMDGYELTASLRAMAQHRHTPVVMLTSRAGEKHRKRAFEVGATEYMVKPYQDEELLSVVRRVVHQARGAVKQ
jgi:chemosensory pili system protein ChpA (sensor histidine kinase/response regulator)